MSYHRSGLGQPAFTSTTAFAQAVDPYSGRFSPPGSIYSPYGWGPDMNIGMPMNYTHHIGYEPTPVPGARRLGPMRDRLSGLGRGPFAPSYRQIPFTNRDDVRYVPLGYHHYYSGVFESGPVYEGDSQRLGGLGGILAVM